MVEVGDHFRPSSDARDENDDPLAPVQREMQSVAASVGGDVRVFGAGIADEFGSVIGDTLLVVVPAAAITATTAAPTTASGLALTSPRTFPGQITAFGVVSR